MAFKRAVFLLALLGTVAGISLMTASAGDYLLTNNTGAASTRWYISGEASLVMNGFDLNARGITLPARIDRISIDIAVAIAGQTVEAVIYQDANGGSPIDATLVRRTTVTINNTGVFNVDFPDPVVISQPVVWIGFYLPVGYEFRADTSGPSVLTYWAWQPNSTFDLNNLASAAVFGPSDGSAPVNINMGGVARITAELVTGAGTPTPLTPLPTAQNVVRQIQGPGGVDLSPMVAYPECANVLYDSADINITYRGGVRFFCRVVENRLSPPAPTGYSRVGVLYDVYVFGVESGVTRLPRPVTHCIRPPASDIDRALFGLAHGAPRQWHILPTVRFGDLICAELHYAGNVSYFFANQ